MVKFGEAQPPHRREDRALLTGRGRFTDDLSRSDQAQAYFLRSADAHGTIRRLETGAAKRAEGVLAVYTAADVDHLGSITCKPPATWPAGRPMYQPPRPILATGRVRHVGEPVAMLVAESRTLAEAAAELVELDIEPLPAVTDVAHAVAPGAPAIWPEAAGNVSLEWSAGDPERVAEALDRAAHVARLAVRNNRLVVNGLEPRAALGDYAPSTGRYTLHTGSQGVRFMHATLARDILEVAPEKLRIVTADVGGGFGNRTTCYPEHALVLFAARELGRPVKWNSTRVEAFLADNHARDSLITGDLALDGHGSFLGLRVAVLVNMGAYLSAHGPFISVNNFAKCIAGVYRTPAVHVVIRNAFTNTVLTGPYRGAGRPEAAMILERLVDQAARETGRDPVELRRRNMIPAAAMPYTSPVGTTYDCGEFEHVLDKALARADRRGFPRRRARSERNDRLRGLGIACYIEGTSAMLAETADIRFTTDGRVVLRSGSQSNGQGHATTWAQIVAARLGVPMDRVVVLLGDSDEAPPSMPSVGSRSTSMAGSAAWVACDRAVERGKALAAHFLEAAAVDIELAGGCFRVAGTDRAIGLFELVRRARESAEALPNGVPEDLDVVETFNASAGTFPNGCHVCEVEIDPETGLVEVVRYTAVDDVGTVINPTIVEGQIHGGVTQGLGQVLGEACVYDSAGQLLTGSFMDYAMPRADSLPTPNVAHHSVPTAANPLGAKGAGETGTTGALAAGINAVMDALAPAGVRHLDMPATPVRVWRALAEARRR